MDENVFDDKSSVPDGRSVLRALGDIGSYWLELRRYIQENYGPAFEEWRYYGQKSGWVMKMVSKKKNLFSFTAIKGGFCVSFVFGHKAIKAIKESDLPTSIMDEMMIPQKYPEGRGLTIEVKDRRSMGLIKTLIKIKAEN